MERDVKELENRIGYRFKDFELLRKALKHSSYTNENHQAKYACNERLEFLGDAVLEVISSEFLYLENPKMPEGELTKMRASIVCEPALAFCAKELNLGEFLMLGKGEETTGGRKRDSVTSDALEAVIGAIYLDGGFANANEFVHKLFYDSKTILQEMVQGNMEGEIDYKLIREEGPDHDKTFTVTVLIGDTVYGEGTGRTKKAAQQQASYQAILKLKNDDKK